MIKVRVERWKYIQQYRFIMQLADFTEVGLVKNEYSTRIVKEFPALKDRVHFFRKEDGQFKELDVKHVPPVSGMKSGTDYYCSLDSVIVRGPFLPRCMIGRARCGPKRQKYTFMGMMHPHRLEELKGYEEWCSEVTRGKVNKVWDAPYWAALSGSEYAICPRGENPWLYRPYEAILAHAIPVMTKEQYEVMPAYDHQFHFFILGEEKGYDRELANENYVKLLDLNQKEWLPLIGKLEL